MTVAFANNSPFTKVLTPRHFLFSTIKSETSSSIKVIFGSFLIASKIISEYFSLSICARSDHTAGPFEVLSILI
ncbi:Uncharacterised protein [Mycoplasmopsis arginini]|nr:Uncharacterised protein [Chlamydia abortus]SGA07351.1 Uncharacterised protein [Mycoplasmopsis arginini]SGA09677.1 Uncharacterised protein [Mycoplasmopsis arginini]SGA32081.1 Uncharacterised protein [Chlamydia abortus]